MKNGKKHRDWSIGEEISTTGAPPACEFAIVRKAREMLDAFIEDSDLKDRVVISRISVEILLDVVPRTAVAAMKQNEDGSWNWEEQESENQA